MSKEPVAPANCANPKCGHPKHVSFDGTQTCGICLNEYGNGKRKMEDCCTSYVAPAEPSPPCSHEHGAMLGPTLEDVCIDCGEDMPEPSLDEVIAAVKAKWPKAYAGSMRVKVEDGSGGLESKCCATVSDFGSGTRLGTGMADTLHEAEEAAWRDAHAKLPAAEPSLEQAINKKSAGIEAAGLCDWKYKSGCPWCDEGLKPVPSSVSDKMVHPDSSVGRVVCTRIEATEGEAKPRRDGDTAGKENTKLTGSYRGINAPVATPTAPAPHTLKPKPIGGDEAVSWDVLWNSRAEWIAYARSLESALAAWRAAAPRAPHRRRRLDISFTEDMKASQTAGAARAWVPVTERLPDFHAKVVVIGEDKISHTAARVRMAGEKGWVWAVKDLNDWASCTSFTHWQELPAPPEAEGSAK